jgi:hypothetical protein
MKLGRRLALPVGLEEVAVPFRRSYAKSFVGCAH